MIGVAAAVLLLGVQSPAPTPPQAAERAPAGERTRLPAFVWRPPSEPGAERPLSAAWRAAFGGVNVEREAPATAERDQRLDFYVGHAPGRNALHLERDSGTYPERWSTWNANRDSRELVRDPCLSDPETRAGLYEQLERTARARDGQHGFGLSLGDEVSLTPWGDPVDLCRSVHCERAFERRLENAGLPREAFPDTDDVRRALVRGETLPIGAWLRRRAFHHEVLAGLIDDLADEARRLAPGTSIGLLGMTGATAFGGLAIERVVPALDFAEAYPTREARELLATVGGDDLLSYCTVIVADTLPRSAAWTTWEHWVRGGDGWILYDGRSLEESREHALEIARAVAEVRAVDRQLVERKLELAPTPAGVALVTSDHARRVAWLRDAARDGPTWPNRFAGYHARTGTLERAVSTWLRLFEDAGALPGAVPLDQVDAATTGRFPLLVLPHVLVASDKDLARLERHLVAGGRLMVQGDPGWIDPAGRRRTENPADAWSVAYPGQVLRPPRELPRYERERLFGADALQARARRWLEEVGHAFAPVAIDDATGQPWLRAERYFQDTRTWIVRAVPNLQTEVERRAHLPRPTPRVAPNPGWTVEWLHPATPESASSAVVLAVRAE